MLLIVPVSRNLARKNFEKTILRTWKIEDLKSIAPHITESLISKLAESHSFGIWGAIP